MRTQRGKAEPEAKDSVSPDLPAVTSRVAAVQRNTLKDQVYAELRRALIAGRFEPGEPVTVKMLSEQLKSGVMPAREAVQRLVAEGALLGLPSGRVRVPELSREEFKEIMGIRLLLEPHACAKAASLADPDDLAEIAAAQGRLAEATRAVIAYLAENAGDAPAPLVEATLWSNYQYQFTLYRASKSPHLVALIESVWLRFGPMIVFALRPGIGDASYLDGALDLQDRLTQAVSGRTPAAAAAVMGQIIEATERLFDKANLLRP